MQWFAEHRKAIVALVGAVATFAVSIGLDNKYEWVGAIVAVLAAAGVYQVRNGADPRKLAEVNTAPPKVIP
jgi:uncharacterized membrane protein